MARFFNVWRKSFVYRTRKLTAFSIFGFATQFVGDLLTPEYHMVWTVTILAGVIFLICLFRVFIWLRKNKTVQKIEFENLLHPKSGIHKFFIEGLAVSTFTILVGISLLVMKHYVSVDKKGVFVSSFPQLTGIQNSLLSINSRLTEISSKLDNVKKETSSDPRKELHNLGVAWNGDNFLEAVKTGDIRIVTLFLDGGMRPETAFSQGRPLPVMLAQNEYNPHEILRLLLQHKVDINYVYKQSTGMSDARITLLSWAIHEPNLKLLEALLRSGADTSRPIDSFGAFGSTFSTWPLAAAIYWKQAEVVNTMLRFGTDIKAGNYAAYKQALTDRSNYYWSKRTSDINYILIRTRPPEPFLSQINKKVRLEEIDRLLNETALKSLQSMTNPYQKEIYDRQYDQLQQEKKNLLQQ